MEHQESKIYKTLAVDRQNLLTLPLKIEFEVGSRKHLKSPAIGLRQRSAILKSQASNFVGQKRVQPLDPLISQLLIGHDSSLGRCSRGFR